VLQCGYTEIEKEIEKEDNTYANGYLSDICQDGVEQPKEPLPSVAESDSDFKWFWNTYNKKKDLKKVEAKWKKITKQNIDAIKTTLESYVKSTPDVKYRKYPLSYLNGECWNDEISDDPLSISGLPLPQLKAGSKVPYQTSVGLKYLPVLSKEMFNSMDYNELADYGTHSPSDGGWYYVTVKRFVMICERPSGSQASGLIKTLINRKVGQIV
jgi:hypothetical protein